MPLPRFALLISGVMVAAGLTVALLSMLGPQALVLAGVLAAGAALALRRWR